MTDRTEQIHEWIGHDAQYLKSVFPELDDFDIEYSFSNSAFAVFVFGFRSNRCIEFGHGYTLTEAAKELRDKLDVQRTIPDQAAKQLGGI